MYFTASVPVTATSELKPDHLIVHNSHSKDAVTKFANWKLKVSIKDSVILVSVTKRSVNAFHICLRSSSLCLNPETFANPLMDRSFVCELYFRIANNMLTFVPFILIFSYCFIKPYNISYFYASYLRINLINWCIRLTSAAKYRLLLKSNKYKSFELLVP